jgi:hypothetical protein
MKTFLFASLAAIAVLLIPFTVHTDPVSAHAGASVALTPTAAAPGDQLQVKIEGYEDNTLVSITLEGVSGSIPLGTVTTDASGAATTSVMIPDGVNPGSYSVKAVGADDNEAADLSIKAAAVTNTSATTGSSTMSDNGAAPPGQSQSATGGNFTYKQPTAQWVGIAIAAFIVALAGFALVLRRERHA